MLEAKTVADERRTRDLAQARLQKTQAETRLHNLYELVADGHASLKETTFTTMLADTNSRATWLVATIDTLARQIGRSAKRVTAEMVDAFAALVRDRLHGEDPARSARRGTWRTARAGRITVFCGLRILATSAMKRTPQKAITSASVAAAFAEIQAVADEIGNVLNIGRLVIMREDAGVAFLA